MTRFTAAEYAIVKQRAQNANLELVVYIRTAALRAEVRKALTEEELSAVKELNMHLRNIGTNINAIARKANSDLARNYTADLRQILLELSKAKDDVIQKLLKDGWKD